MLKLGLIGDNIKASRSPALQRIAGELAGRPTRYDLYIPPELELTFDETFAKAQADGLAGTNVTLPYKERVVPHLRIDDPLVARIGACNTVLFAQDGPRGFNTDYSGFVAAYRAQFGDMAPGRVVQFGAGGVGRAVAFGLVALGASEVVLVDMDHAKAEALAQAITRAGDGVTTGRAGSIDDLDHADGVVNCTPLGMVGYGGSAVPEGRFPTANWSFDAVYTPAVTPFAMQSEAAGTPFLSGWELFFWQGVHGFEIFSGLRLEATDALRARLLDLD
ncbi:MAG: shikimate dehydrogenase [Celeribacter sp.]|jgi:shikimate dehydrogenase